jgi:uncharacterized membrane protein YkoI
MKNPIIASIIIGFSMLFIMETAIATEQPLPQDVIKITSAIQKMQAKGYKNIHEIKFKNGYYEAEVFSTEGNKLELRMNSKTGEIEVPKSTPKYLTMLEIIKKIQAEGYDDIRKVSFDDGEYHVAVVDKKGNSTDLRVNGETGQVKKDWF